MKTFVVAEANVPNHNGRIYSKELLEKIYSEFHSEIIGQMDTSNGGPVPLSEVSHIVKSLRIDGDKLVADILILNTPKGRILQEILNMNAIEFRMEGIGEVADGIVKDFKLTNINAFPNENTSSL